MANYGILPQQYNGTTYDTLYFKNSLNGTTAPTTSTVAYYVGQLYINTTNGDIFKCTAISAPTYTWKPITNQSIIADYIVAQGTSGIWTYRKWNSGKFDMCCFFNNASDGMTINMPFAVIELYGSFVCGHYNTSTSVTSFYSFDFDNGATSGILHAFDPSGSARTISTLSGHIFVYGRYK